MNKVKKYFSANIREISLILVIILLALFVEVRSGGNFLRAENISDMLTETAVLGITALGMMAVILTGGIDLSVGAIMALSAMVGSTVLKNTGLFPLGVIIISVIIGILSGFVNGFLVAKVKIIPIIATLGTMNVLRGLTYLVSGGSWVMQQDMGPEFLSLATGSLFGINNLILIAAGVYIVFGFFLNLTRTGRNIYAVGNSKESAVVSGIKADRILILVYVILGAIAGLGGILYVCKYGVAQGESLVGYEMNVIASCVLGGVSITGGTGKVKGVLLGALLLGMLNNAMPLIRISSFWQEAIRGLIILFSIIINSAVQRNVEMKALRRRKI